MVEIVGPIIPGLFAELKPETILNYYDGPRIFTCRSVEGELCLACWSDENEEASRFVVVAITARTLRELQEGRISVRSAIDQPLCWAVDCLPATSSTLVRRISLEEYPNDALPQPGVMLQPQSFSVQ